MLSYSVLRRHWAGSGCLLLALVLAWTAATAKSAVVFNWPSPPGWNAGQPGSGQTKTENFTSVTANDISVSIFNSGINNQGGYPAVNSTNTTGGFTGVNALQLYISSPPTFGAYLRTTVSFTTPVVNLSFQLWDVDAAPGQFIDKVQNIQAIDWVGTTIGATTVTSAVPGFNSISGTGLSTVIVGTAGATNTTNQGTIDITFTGPVSQFSFEWSNNDPARGAQAIGLGPLTYTIVPEHSSAFPGVLGCVVAVVFEAMRRKGRRLKGDLRDRRLTKG